MRSKPLDGAGEALLQDAGAHLGSKQAEKESAHARRAGWRSALSGTRSAAYSLTGLFLFILALQLLKSGAGGLKPILKALDVHGPVNTLGFGWLGAYVVMSGSPVAAISLSRRSKGTSSDVEGC